MTEKELNQKLDEIKAYDPTIPYKGIRKDKKGNIKVILPDDQEIRYDSFSAKPPLTGEYWDCECMNFYIQPASEKTCAFCGAESSEQPDSHLNEVAAWKLKLPPFLPS